LNYYINLYISRKVWDLIHMKKRDKLFSEEFDPQVWKGMLVEINSLFESIFLLYKALYYIKHFFFVIGICLKMLSSWLLKSLYELSQIYYSADLGIKRLYFVRLLYYEKKKMNMIRLRSVSSFSFGYSCSIGNSFVNILSP